MKFKVALLHPKPALMCHIITIRDILGEPWEKVTSLNQTWHFTTYTGTTTALCWHAENHHTQACKVVHPLYSAQKTCQICPRSTGVTTWDSLEFQSELMPYRWPCWSLCLRSPSLFELQFSPGCCDKDTRLPVGEKAEIRTPWLSTIRHGQTVKTIWHRATWKGISMEFLILIVLFISPNLCLENCPFVCADSYNTVLSKSIGLTKPILFFFLLYGRHLGLRSKYQYKIIDQHQHFTFNFLIFTSRCVCLNPPIFQVIKSIRNVTVFSGCPGMPC